MVQAPNQAALTTVYEGIALLIDLAERGEIDPWDVQVIEVIDRFLSRLSPEQQRTGRIAYESDLSQSGQAFLYASILLLLKAENLARSDSQAEDLQNAEEDLALELNGLATAPLPLHLDRQLRRRAAARPPQQRRVTLQELIEQLKLVAATIADRPATPRPRRPRPQSRSQTVRAITQLAHQENLSEVAAELEQFLQTGWTELAPAEEWLDFEILLERWPSLIQIASHLEEHDSGHDLAPEQFADRRRISERVGVFWALLLLSAQSKVELSQEEFYQDLRIRPFSL